MNKNKLKIFVTSKDDSSKRISLSTIEELSKDRSNTKSIITIEPIESVESKESCRDRKVNNRSKQKADNKPVSYTQKTLPTKREE